MYEGAIQDIIFKVVPSVTCEILWNYPYLEWASFCSLERKKTKIALLSNGLH